MRILAIFSLSLSVAVFVANYVLPVSILLPLALFFLALDAVLLLFRRKWLRGIELSLFGLAVGLGVFLVKYNNVTVPCRELDGERVTIRAYLTDYPDVYEDYCLAYVKISDRRLPDVNAILYVSDMSLSEGKPGQVIEAEAKLHSADMRYGREYDRYNARDIFLTANAGSAVITGETKQSVCTVSAIIRRAIGNEIDKFYKPREAAFLKALILGDKSALYKETGLYNSLCEAGIMHVAAVSGLHIAFLVSLLGYLLGRGRRGAIFSIIIVWVFVLTTGASPSAVRAGFMQSLLLLAPIFRRENDPVTSLSAVLAMVLIQNPYAAASLSLQLSFGAMAGILLLERRIFNALVSGLGDRVKKILEKPIAVISSSLAVMVFTVPLTAVYFGYVSVPVPITNVLTMWTVTICFYAGIAGIVLSVFIPPLGAAVAFAVSLVEKYIFAVVAAVTDIPYSTVYLTEKVMAVWLAAAAAIVLIFCLSKFSDRKKLLASVFSAVLMLYMANAVTARSYSLDKCSFSVIDVGQGQSIAVISDDKTVVIDCGGGAKEKGAGQTAAAHLLSRGRRKIDALVLTHLHSDHMNGVAELMEKTDVKLIILPDNAENNEGVLAEILDIAGQRGCEVICIDTDKKMNFGKIELELYAPGEKGGVNERCLMCSVGAAGKNMLITADAPISAENELTEKTDLSGTEYLIAGHHGSRYSSGGKLLEAAGGETAIISVGYNTYGHPADETLARLSAYGYNVLRTDINGTVEIRIR